MYRMRYENMKKLINGSRENLTHSKKKPVGEELEFLASVLAGKGQVGGWWQYHSTE